MTLSLRRDVSVSDVEDGVVLLDERNGRYWHLNGTAGTMLRLLLDGSSPEVTAARIAGSDADLQARVAADIHTLIDGLRRAKLVAAP